MARAQDIDSQTIEQIMASKLESSTGKRKWFFWGVGGLILASVIFFALHFNSSNNATLQYKTKSLDKGSLTVKVTATGTLQPMNQVELSSEVSGTVKSVLVSENDLIKQGETLLVLDTTTLEAQVAQAQANEVAAQAAVKQSEVSLSEAKNKYLRTKELYVSGTVSQDSLDTLESTYLRAQSNLVSSLAQLDQVRAGLRLQQDSLRKATVIAPLDGVVLQREIDPGQTVVASLQAPTLFVLAKDLTHMELYLNVDEADIGKISQNMMAEFTVDAYPDQLFTAKISKVHLSPQTVDGVVTYETHLCVDNPHNILRPGMTATADIIVTEVSDALLLPNSALRYRPAVIQEEEVKSVMSQLFPRPKSSESSKELQKDESNTVWVLRGGKEVQVAVEVGMTDGIHTEIKGGDLLKSDQVIIGRIKTQGN